MKAIGRVLACVLLAAAFAKNVLATSTANIKFSKERGNEVARPDVTRLELVSVPSSLNADVEGSRSIQGDVLKSEANRDIEESRTFGRKRIQLLLMPILYKLGAMMTMMMILLAISAKSLLVGIILLVFKISSFLAKHHSGWHGESSQPIHVHVHNSYPYAHEQAYQSWIPASAPAQELNPYYYKG